MKKTYEKPELHIDRFDVEDVITASGLVTTITDAFETLVGNAVQFIQSLGDNH